MKKITFIALAAFFTASTMFAQTFSTGQIPLSTTAGLEYTGQIDVTSSEAKVTLIGPADRYLGFGFGSPLTTMTTENDVILIDQPNGSYTNGTIISVDRTFQGVGAIPFLDESPPNAGFMPGVQSWTLVSDDVVGNVRTIVLTRAPNTGDPYDYVFSASAGSVDVVWSYGNGPTFVLGWHGANRDSVPNNGITLSTPNFNEGLNFSIAPNPAKEKFVVTLPTNIDNAQLDVYNVLGKRIISQDISDIDNTINVANWNSGIYIVRVSNGDVSQTKRFVKQ